MPKVNSACNSVHRSVETTVITAFATAHGIVMATSGTAKLDRTPIPPPQTTKRTKEASGPGAAEYGSETWEEREGVDGDLVLSAVCGSMVVFPPACREQHAPRAHFTRFAGLRDLLDPWWIS